MVPVIDIILTGVCNSQVVGACEGRLFESRRLYFKFWKPTLVSHSAQLN